MGEERKEYKVLMGKPEGKSPVGRPRCRREDGIQVDVSEIGWNGFISLRNTVMNFRVLAPRNSLVSKYERNSESARAS
jgi:hypothetical protein